MSVFTHLKQLTPSQRHAVVASFLGWSLDAFDFFIFVFILSEIASEFSAGETLTTFAVVLTSAGTSKNLLHLERRAQKSGCSGLKRAATVD
jgi:SHS family lactate transporter-like MFS transporter